MKATPYRYFLSAEQYTSALRNQRRSQLNAVAKKREGLDPSFDLDDLVQEAEISSRRAMGKWEHTHAKNIKFSTWMHWYYQKHTQSLLNGRDKLVEILDETGERVGEVSYAVWRKLRPTLVKQRYQGRVSNRLIPLETVEEVTRNRHD